MGSLSKPRKEAGMIFSLPSYRRLSEADLARLRRDDERYPFNRVVRMLLNLLLLSGLWGMPLYARWIVLPDIVGVETKNLPKAILGEWWSDRKFGEWWNEHKAVVELTAAQQVRLFWEGALIETADYRIVENVLEVSDFRSQPVDHRLLVNPQRFQISIHGNQLILTPASFGFTPIPENAVWEGSSLRLVLPTWQGWSVTFWRRDNR
jgi:hypothetical protein